MKYILLALALTACSVSPNTGRNLAVQVGNTVEVRNLTSTTLDQNTLALTGADKTFTARVKNGEGTCKITDEELNIWGCNLGSIESTGVKVVEFTGTLLSGNLFSYEKGTNRFLPTVVIVP